MIRSQRSAALVLLAVTAVACRGGADDAGPAAPVEGEARETAPTGKRGAATREAATHVVGTADADTLVGTDGDDVILGGGGDDAIAGGAGDDTLYGGEGDDVIEGGAGADVIYGDGGSQASVAAARFLVQASFGGSRAEIERVAARGAEVWFAEQAAMPQRSVLARFASLEAANHRDLTGIWWERAIFADDQLRQRVAYALSQITVASLELPALQTARTSFAVYMDHLERQALGNYEDLIHALTFDPAMGLWLSHIANAKADPEAGNAPDENYARELMQLFTIGTVPLDASGRALTGQAFSNTDVEGLAAVMTGLSWANQGHFKPWIPDPADRTLPMQAYPAYHEEGEKTFLGTTVVGGDVEASIRTALDALLAHPNVPPFVATRLIQRLTSSSPSPDYVRRVAAAYETGRYRLPSGTITVGEGRRGDMTATVAAILFDEEARTLDATGERGKLREPVLRLAHLLRAYRLDREEGPTAPRGVLGELASSTRLGQAPLHAPSVFNFYQAGHRAPGSDTDALGLVAPELQIMTTANAAGYAAWATGFTRTGGFGDFMTWDYASLLARADDPAALADELDLVLTRGRMTPALRERIAGAVAAFPMRAGSEEVIRLARIRLALALVVTSPEYAIQR